MRGKSANGAGAGTCEFRGGMVKTSVGAVKFGEDAGQGAWDTVYEQAASNAKPGGDLAGCACIWLRVFCASSISL